jgi:hypothetical protein
LEPEVLISLDEPGPERSARRSWARRLSLALHRRVPLPVLLGLVLLGAVAGGAAALRWDASRQRAAAESRASLYVLIERPPAMLRRTGEGMGMIDTFVTAVNTGPLPVELLAVDAAEQGLTISDRTRRMLPAAVATSEGVEIRIDCRIGMPTGAVELHLRVGLANGGSRTLSHFAALPDGVRNACFRL